MSCDSSVRCLDCSVEWDGWENHAGRDMTILAAEGSALGAFAASFDKISRLTEVEFKVGRVQLHAVDLAWFAAHAGHRLGAVDQNGVVDGTCGEFDQGPHVRGRLTRVCHVAGDRNHMGPHDFQVPWTTKWVGAAP